MRNRLFVLSVLWPVSVFTLSSALIDETSLVLNISAYVLQLSGLITTIKGLLSSRAEFGARSPAELLKGLFRMKPVVVATGDSTLMKFEQTVLDVSPVTAAECKDSEEKLEVNINLLLEHINSDRLSIRYLLSRQKDLEDDIQKSIGERIGKNYRTVERIHLHGSGLALVGLFWVGAGMTQAAITSLMAYS
jgi:hypothetical protein